MRIRNIQLDLIHPMKQQKLFLIAGIVLFSTILYAQNEIKSANTIKQRLDSVIYVGANTKADYLYNNLGQNTSFIHYTWNNSLMSYEKDYKKEYAYNTIGLCILEQFFVWNKVLAIFEIKNKKEMSYDENNQLLLKNTYDWSLTENKWVFTEKIDFENIYDGNKNLISILSYRNAKTLADIEKIKYEYTYGTNGSLSSVILSEWISYSWKKSLTEIYSYDLDGNLYKIALCSYTSSYSLSTQSEYELKYNNAFTTDQLQIPDLYFSNSGIMPQINFRTKHMITIQTSLNSGVTLEWTKRYYYSLVEVTEISNQELLKTAIFPNPSSDFLNIQWIGNQASMYLKLYDLTGNEVLNENVNNNSIIPIQKFNKGLYLLKITDNEKTAIIRKVVFN